MLKTILLTITVLALARAQVPGLGWCPEYVPMANFDIGKFLGNWYEAERSLQLPELGSRCAMVSYTKGSDNKLHVSNIISRFLGFQRVIEGEVILPSTKAEEGKLNLRYTTSLSNLPSNYHVLETDYRSYAVLWNCNSLGPVHTENLWIMTRDRTPSSETLQKAYAVLDKYKISKSYLIQSDQTDCKYTGVENIPIPAEATLDNSEPTEAPQQLLRSAINPSEIGSDGDKESSKPQEAKVNPVKGKIVPAITETGENKLLSSAPLGQVTLSVAETKEEVKKAKFEEPAVVAVAEPIKKPVGASGEKPLEEKKN